MGTFMNGYNHLWSLYFQTDLCVYACGVPTSTVVSTYLSSTNYHHISW